MNKTTASELYRVFLIEKLPEPLIPASRHLQLFDRSIEGTRLWLRQIRDPYSNEWTRILLQRSTSTEGREVKTGEIHLDEREYALFARFNGPEIRRNRYFHEYDLTITTFDIYLGPLKGLGLARVGFETTEDARDFVPLPYMVMELTDEPFITTHRLAHSTFDDVAAEIKQCATSTRGYSKQGEVLE